MVAVVFIIQRFWKVRFLFIVQRLFGFLFLSIIVLLYFVHVNWFNLQWNPFSMKIEKINRHSLSAKLFKNIELGNQLKNNINIEEFKPLTNQSMVTINRMIGMCPLVSPFLVGWVDISKIASDSRKERVNFFNLRMAKKGLKLGGKYKPRNCNSRNILAIIVPFRERDFHKKIFMRHMHPFLMRQQLEYTIFIIEQSSGSPFNRGMLMNIGYNEALKQDYSFQCFIFHDVDLLPEDDRNPYICPEIGKPRQMAFSLDIYDYKPTPENHFGGVTAFSKTDFQLINGFSNAYWGWGSEDDDLYWRVVYNNLTITRMYEKQTTSKEIIRYRMIDHRKAKSNPDRDLLYDDGINRLQVDGLKNLKYRKLILKLNPLYTHIIVDLKKE